MIKRKSMAILSVVRGVRTYNCRSIICRVPWKAKQTKQRKKKKKKKATYVRFRTFFFRVVRFGSSSGFQNKAYALQGGRPCYPAPK